MVEQRESWREKLKGKDVKQLVFLDESGCNINLTRRYGRAKGKQRVVDSVPFSKDKNTTIVSSIRLDGSTKYTTYSGGTTGEKFITYLKETLIPGVHKGDIVIMDNLRTHHMNDVKVLLEEAGLEILYLPPYSPDLNPIEMMWSKIKSILRKMKERTTESLLKAIPEALKQISPEDSAGWFKKAGYV